MKRRIYQMGYRHCGNEWTENADEVTTGNCPACHASVPPYRFGLLTILTDVDMNVNAPNRDEKMVAQIAHWYEELTAK